MHLQRNLVAPVNDYYLDVKSRKHSSTLRSALKQGRNESTTKHSAKKKGSTTTDSLMKEVHALNQMFSISQSNLQSTKAKRV